MVFWCIHMVYPSVSWSCNMIQIRHLSKWKSPSIIYKTAVCLVFKLSICLRAKRDFFWFLQWWEKWKASFLTFWCRGIETQINTPEMIKRGTERWMKGGVLPWRMFLCSSSSAVGLWLSRLKTQNTADYSILTGWYGFSLKHTFCLEKCISICV